MPKLNATELVLVGEITRDLRANVLGDRSLFLTLGPRFLSETQHLEGEVRTRVVQAQLRALGYHVVPRFDLALCYCCVCSARDPSREGRPRWYSESTLDKRFLHFYTVVVPFRVNRRGYVLGALALATTLYTWFCASWLVGSVWLLALLFVFVRTVLLADTPASLQCGLCAPHMPRTAEWAESPPHMPRSAEWAESPPQSAAEELGEAVSS